MSTIQVGAFSAYMAEPGGAPRAAIIVIQEIFGVNAGIRQKCDNWARVGYLAVAPDQVRGRQSRHDPVLRRTLAAAERSDAPTTRLLLLAAQDAMGRIVERLPARSLVPGMRVLAPSSAQELQAMLHDALELADEGPVVIRYPNGTAPQVGELEVGVGLHANLLRRGDGSVCILAIGKLVSFARSAAVSLAEQGIDATVWDVRSCAPLDPAMIADAATHAAVVTCEDGIRDGGIGMTIADQIHDITGTVPVDVLGLPGRFIQQGKPDRILAQLGLDADGIAATVRRRLTDL